MLEAGIIESSANRSSPVVLVKEKDGTIRFSVGYRELNTVTKRDVYPLPRIDDALDALSENACFTTLESLSGYWQVQMHPDHEEKTAFCTPDGLHQFRRMPFGLANAPATFQRLMDRVTGPLKYRMALVYLDDIIEAHLSDLKEVLHAIRAAGLKLRAKKCMFGTEASQLGRGVNWAAATSGPRRQLGESG